MASADPNDLYDDVVTGSVDHIRLSGGEARMLNKDQAHTVKVNVNTNLKPQTTFGQSGLQQGKRLSVYVGNFSWVSFLYVPFMYYLFILLSKTRGLVLCLPYLMHQSL